MKYGLVLGGGGAKGAYEVGVWEALEEMGLAGLFTTVVGTSVGALNAALFAQGKLDAAKEIWSTMQKDTVLSPRKNRAVHKSWWNQKGLRALLEQNLDSFSQGVDAYACCVRIVSASRDIQVLGMNLDEEYEPHFAHLNQLSKEDAVSFLLASSGLPFAYPTVKIRGEEYRDGGLLPAYNLPWKKAVDLGCRRILAVALNEQGMYRRLREDDAEIMMLRPSVYLGGLAEGTMDFDEERCRGRMRLGREDALHFEEDIHRFLEDRSVPERN